MLIKRLLRGRIPEQTQYAMDFTCLAVLVIPFLPIRTEGIRNILYGLGPPGRICVFRRREHPGGGIHLIGRFRSRMDHRLCGLRGQPYIFRSRNNPDLDLASWGGCHGSPGLPGVSPAQPDRQILPSSGKSRRMQDLPPVLRTAESEKTLPAYTTPWLKVSGHDRNIPGPGSIFRSM